MQFSADGHGAPLLIYLESVCWLLLFLEMAVLVQEGTLGTEGACVDGPLQIAANGNEVRRCT
jgi:hypothetical protein